MIAYESRTFFELGQMFLELGVFTCLCRHSTLT